MIDVGSAAALLGTLGIGSVAGQYVTSAKDRRSARAEVLNALGAVESARWAPHTEGAPSFRDAARALQTAALVARVPRALLVEYLQLAQAACWRSFEKWEEDPDPEYGGGISADFADAVRQAARSLSDVIWVSPLLRWPIQYRGLRKVRHSLSCVDDKPCLGQLANARRHGIA